MGLSIAFRYIFRKLLANFCVISPIATLMLWIAMSIKYVDLIVSENISFAVFFKLILCTLPSIAAIILPICFLISSILSIQKLHTDEEIVVFLTSGKSPISLFLPLIILGVMIASCVLYLRTTASPMAFKTFENMQEQIKSSASINLLKPGVFNVVGESVIYIGARNHNHLENVFISYIPNDRTLHTNIISAENGEYATHDGKILINFNNGYRQEFDRNNRIVATLKFEKLSYDVTQFFKRFYKKPKRPSDKSQEELLAEALSSPNSELTRNFIAEYHARYVFSLLPIFYSLIIAIFMLQTVSRGRTRQAVLKAASGGVICQILFITLVSVSTRSVSIVYYNYYIISVLLILLLICFIFRRK